MQDILNWVSHGGPPPWGASAREAEQAIEILGHEYLAEIAAAKALREAFKWRDFLRLDASWSKFETLYKFCSAQDMRGVSGFSASFLAANEKYDELQNVGRLSRGLAIGIRRLCKHPRLPKWQKDILEGCGLGDWGFQRQADRQKRLIALRGVEDLQQKCAKNIQGSIEDLCLPISSKRLLAGAPPWLLDVGRARAKSAGRAGWVFQANDAEYETFMTHVQARESRACMYRLKAKGCSEHVPARDNATLAKKLLQARKAQAALDGHKTSAHKALVGAMLDTPEKVEAFLMDMAANAMPLALMEKASIEDWMREREGVARLEPWDYRFAKSQMSLKDKSCVANSESVAYFPASGAIERCVIAACDFWGMSAARIDSGSGAGLLSFEIDPGQGLSGHLAIMARQGERSGSTPFEWTLGQASKVSEISPSSIVFLNLASPGAKVPNLCHEEIIQVLHEVGHAIHSMFCIGACSMDGARGISGDAIEMPSQLTEMLAWRPDVLEKIGRKQGRPMPRQMAEDLASGRNFHSGAAVLSKISESLCDLRLHTTFNPRGRLAPWEVMVAVRQEIAMDKPKSYSRRAQQLPSMGGAYVCASHGYLWSEGIADKILRSWEARQSSAPERQAATRALQSIFLHNGTRRGMASQVRSFTGAAPCSKWVAQSRGFA